MAYALKNIYNDDFFKEFIAAVGTVMPGLDRRKFASVCRGKDWEQKELKQRMRHIASTPHVF